MAEARSSRPDVLLIVLDCVRSDLFEAEVARPDALPFLHSLRSQVASFPRTASTASWTIPGHASLFTGLYPWDHGAHCRLGPILTREPETIAEFLQREGYATGFFSANSYVQPSTGLARGFQETLWGGAREFFLRFASIQKAGCPDLGGHPLTPLPASSPGARPSPLRDLAMSSLPRLPAVWDAMNRTGGKLLGTYAKDMHAVCPWIEPELDGWLARQRPDQPVFAFVNLVEAHEPYLADGGDPVSVGRWLSYARSGQDSISWIRGAWTPSPREVASVRAGYVRSLRTLDRRVQQIVERFASRRDWDNTLFVLTSDHGQAFLEQDLLYHRFRVDEPIARIPLWIRSPGSAVTGARSDEWASLVDVPRTIAARLGRTSFGDAGSRDLLDPASASEGTAVYCMTDGMPAGEERGVDEARRHLLDRLEVAAYRGNVKAVAGEVGDPSSYRVSAEAVGVPTRLAGDSAEPAAVIELARAAIDLARARISSRAYHGSVEHRIAGWGY